MAPQMTQAPMAPQMPQEGMMMPTQAPQNPVVPQNPTGPQTPGAPQASQFNPDAGQFGDPKLDAVFNQLTQAVGGLGSVPPMGK
jgi:hypothetical protein